MCTGYVSIDPSSDDSPLPYATLWDEDDVRSHALMTEAVHEQGALAGIELWHGGGSVMNRSSRLPPMSPSGTCVDGDPRELHGQPAAAQSWRRRTSASCSPGRRKRHARRSRAGFDIVYVYAGMGYLPYEFLLSGLEPAHRRLRRQRAPTACASCASCSR